MAKRSTVIAKDKSELYHAVNHVEVACRGVSHYAPYCHFAPGWLVGYDGIVAAGHRNVTEINAAPHTETFRHALARAGSRYSLTILSNGNVAVRGDKMRVEVPTMSADAIPNVQPDRPQAEVPPSLRDALTQTSRVTSAKQERVIACSVALNNMSCVGTDGGTILEAYHGSKLPERFLIPREFCEALGKLKTVPTTVGWSDTTLTLWFGDDAWLRCNTYEYAYPDTTLIIANLVAECGRELRPVPETLLLGLDTLKPFLEPGKRITITASGINTRSDGSGAAYTLPHHMPYPREVPYDGLRYAAEHGEWIAFGKDAFYWYGQVLRGATSLR